MVILHSYVSLPEGTWLVPDYGSESSKPTPEKNQHSWL